MQLIKAKNKKSIYTFILLIVFLIISVPALRSGVYNGFDLWFHMGRIESIATELSNGQFPVRYETMSWYGNGYISTTTYGNIFLYIPALLHLAGIVTYRCYNIYVALINAIGVCIAWYSFNGLFKDRFWALISTAMYMLSGYYISNVYMRAAVGEYTAMIFIPLVVYGIYRIYFEEAQNSALRKVLPLVIGVSGIIQSHVLAAVLLALAVLIFAFAYIRDTLKNIKSLLLALGLILLLNSFFIVPFIESYTSYVFNASVESVGVNIQKNGLYLGQLLGLFPEGSGYRVDWSSEGKEYLRIGIVHVVALLSMVIIIIFNKKLITNSDKKKSFKAAVIVFVIGLLAAWMSSAYFPWNIFSGDNFFSNLMRSVQYPSRYLILQTIAWTVCGVYALKTIGENFKPKWQTIYRTSAFVLIGCLVLMQTAIFMYTLSCRNRTVTSIEGHENIADGLYLRVGTDTDNLITEATILDGNAEIKDLGYEGKWRYIEIKNNSDSKARVLIPIFNYNHINAYASNGEKLSLSSTDNNQYQLSVDAGFSDTVHVGFEEPFLWRVSEMISLLILIIIVAMLIKEKKENP